MARLRLQHLYASQGGEIRQVDGEATHRSCQILYGRHRPAQRRAVARKLGRRQGFGEHRLSQFGENTWGRGQGVLLQ